MYFQARLQAPWTSAKFKNTILVHKCVIDDSVSDHKNGALLGAYNVLAGNITGTLDEC